MKNQENPSTQLLAALVLCALALAGTAVHLLWPVVFVMALIVGISGTSLLGFSTYSLLMLSLGMYLLTRASQPSMRALETWTDKQLHDYEDR
jgi:membrane protein implicated in regulation of membrane protease activity